MSYDVIVIGTGQAGVPLATRFAKAGKRVLLAERAKLGGTCVNVGCTPTKTMIASARAAHVARTAGRLGVHARAVEVDFPAIAARKDAIVKRWREGVETRVKDAGELLTLVCGHARFVGERKVEIAGEVHSADIVVVNVGARPVTPRIEGLADVPWLHYGTALDLRELPDHLVIIGGGYIGCEFAQMFRRFGSRVTVIQNGPHLLPREDPDVSGALEKVFAGESIDLALEATVSRVGRDGPGISVQLDGGRTVRGSHLLVATGRQPNTDELGCDAGGIKLDRNGAIVADDRYRTSAPGTYAVGDVLGGPQFTHTSWDDHRLLFDILMGRSQRGRRGRVIPYTVFTDPQVAGAGLTEREARSQGFDIEVATLPFGSIARAIEVDETAGVMKLILDRKTERVLGASLMGLEAGELIHIFVVLMQAGASPRAIVEAEAVHPTFAEGAQSLVMSLPRFALY